MSISIHGAFRLSITDIFELQTWLSSLRPIFTNASNFQYTSSIMDKCCSILDRQYLIDQTIKPRAFSSAKRHKDDEMKDRADELDATYRVNICLYPHDGRIYGQFFGFETARNLFFSNTDVVERFEYWDSSEHPEQLSAAEWEHRKEVWSAIISNDRFARPRYIGFNFDHKPEFYLLEMHDYLASHPTLEQRAKAIARDKVFADYGNRTGATSIQNSFSNYMWLMSREGQLEVDNETQKIMPQLLPRYEKDHLTY